MLNDNVLVSEMKPEDVTDGGIILPDKAQKKLMQGTVIAVGPGLKLENGSRFELDLKPGSVVFYPERVGDKIEIKGRQYLCIPERYIAGVLVEADEDEEGPYSKEDKGLYSLDDGEPVSFGPEYGETKDGSEC